MSLTEEQIEIIERLESDFAFRIKNCIKIIDKETGKLVNFTLNKVQQYIHDRLEDQRKRTGKVRAIIVKGRKQGASTYVEARFFDAMMREENSEAFILAHRKDTVDAIYDMVSRFHREYPDYKSLGSEGKPLIYKQAIIEQNASRFAFENGSAYSVGTAGKGDIGRGFTIRKLHLSEAAYYENGEGISSGIMKAVPDAPDTEIIVESTACGTSNLFYDLAQKAKHKKGSFELIFVPWFWQDEYRKKLPENFRLSEEETNYKEVYGLDDEQIYWRRIETEDFSGGLKQFKSEYPATVEEAFEATSEGSLFNIEDILLAKKEEPIQDKNRIVIGLDVAGSSNRDRTVFVFKKGRNLFRSEVYIGWDTSAIVGRCVQIFKTYNPVIMFIDKGYNPGVYDRLVELGWSNKTIGVNFGSSADEPGKFKNKRSEMYIRFSKWLKDKPCSISMENSDDLQNELMLIKKLPPDSNGREGLISKDEIRKKYNLSPDIADAAALCFAYPIATYEDIDIEEEEEQDIKLKGRNNCSGY